MSVRLRPLRDDDAAWLDGWLAAVAASVSYDAVDHAAPATSLLQHGQREPSIRLRAIERDRAVGIVVYRLDARRHCGMFELVATEPAQARRGIGIQSAALAEEEMRTAGVRTIYAPAPETHGIDIYFWVRLGYRPILRGGWPCAVEGIAWLRRDLPDDQTKGTKPSTKSKAFAPK